MKPRPDRHCPHCRSSAERKHCAKCNRRMCADCISLGEMGDTCGLCLDREQAQSRYQEYISLVNAQTIMLRIFND